jgi:hypothetical protein
MRRSAAANSFEEREDIPPASTTPAAASNLEPTTDNLLAPQQTLGYNDERANSGRADRATERKQMTAPKKSAQKVKVRDLKASKNPQGGRKAGGKQEAFGGSNLNAKVKISPL